VVGNGGIVRVFIGPVVFYPGIETGFGNWLYAVARRIFNCTDHPGNCLKILLRAVESGPSDGPVVVIRSKPFRYPKHVRVILGLVIEWAKGRRTEPLYIPEMEILVGHQPHE